MILNWTLEGLKWRFLIRKIHSIRNKEVISSISLGMCANILAPNRIGELAGRLNYLPLKKRRSALYLNLFGASSQLLITVLAGSLALNFMINDLEFIPPVWHQLILWFTIPFSLGSVLIFFRSRLINRLLLKKLRMSTKPGQVVDIDFWSRFKVLLLSAFRYLIFLIQFYLLLQALGAMVSFIESSLILSISFLLNSFIPSNWLSEILNKGSVIYFFFDLMGHDPILAISASLGLWFINLLLPSILSLYFLKDINWMRLTRV